MHDDWSMYKSPDGAYTMEIPPMWQIQHSDIEQHLILFVDKDDAYRMEVYVVETKTTDLDAYVKKHDAEIATAYEGQPGIGLKGKEKISIGGVAAINRHEFANAAGFDTYMAYVLHGGKIYEINFLRMDGEPMTGEDATFFMSVLATVKFQ